MLYATIAFGPTAFSMTWALVTTYFFPLRSTTKPEPLPFASARSSTFSYAASIGEEGVAPKTALLWLTWLTATVTTAGRTFSSMSGTAVDWAPRRPAPSSATTDFQLLLPG